MVFQNGSQIYLGNGNCIQNNQTWVDVCISLSHMMPFCDIFCFCGVNPHCKFPNSLNQNLATGICS